MPLWGFMFSAVFFSIFTTLGFYYAFDPIIKPIIMEHAIKKDEETMARAKKTWLKICIPLCALGGLIFAYLIGM